MKPQLHFKSKHIKLLQIPVLLCLLALASCSKDDESTATPVEENNAPNTFNLVAVTADAVGVDVLPSFSWKAAIDPDDDAVTYNLYMDTEANPTTLIAEDLTTTNYTVTDRLNLYQTYYWKVEASDAKDTTTSSIHSFSTRGLRFPNEPVTADAKFSTRIRHTSVVFHDKMWVIGGFDGVTVNGDKNDVWYSSDGATWTEATASADFSKRSGHTSVVFDDKLWVIGGSKGRNKNDVWYSSDGVTWTEATDGAPFSEKGFHTSVVFDDKIWVIGSDIWYSSDGASWAEASAAAPFFPRYDHTSVVFDNKILVIAGVDENGVRKNDVLYSSNGVTWTQATASADFSKRRGHTSVVFDDKIWVIGGYVENNVKKNDIWYSSDGITWTEANEAPSFFSKRDNHSSVVFDDKMWVIGGKDSVVKNDVWAFD